MKKVLLHNKVIIVIADDAYNVGIKDGEWDRTATPYEGIYVPQENCIYPKYFELLTLEVPDGVVPYKYCYDGGRFYINPEYVIPDELKNSVIDEYTLQLIEEGVI